MTRYLHAKAYCLCFDGDDDAAAQKAADDAAAKKAADDAAAAAAAGGGDKTFSQEDLNRFLAEDKRKSQEKQRILATELEEMKTQKNLTVKQKADLQIRIDDLQAQYMTVEEKARQESERQQKEHSVKLRAAEEDRDSWKKRHTQLAIFGEIAAASNAHGGIQLEQIAAILSPKTKLVEKLDPEGQLTGEYVPQVSFDDFDKEKKPIILELSVDEAVARMRELPKHQNLFHTDKRGGLGERGSSSSPGKKVDMARLAREDQAAYRELRKKRTGTSS